MNTNYIPLVIFIISSLVSSCVVYDDDSTQQNTNETLPIEVHLNDDHHIVYISSDIRIKEYFTFMDSLSTLYSSLLSEDISEHIIVHANPWLIDSLVSTDYYYQKSLGNTMYSQRDHVILRNGDTLIIPEGNAISDLKIQLDETRIDVNIPEYVLRIIQRDSLIYTLPIRVGRNEKKYLLTADRIEDLRTKTGNGYIYEVNRDPDYINPVNGHIYTTTLRDDTIRTALPQIPFLYPEINGYKYGQLIHPTTNAHTLGKAYSNGCIGSSEGDAWRIYYYAPIGTKIRIQYDLDVVGKDGKRKTLKDIYKDQNTKTNM